MRPDAQQAKRPQGHCSGGQATACVPVSAGMVTLPRDSVFQKEIQRKKPGKRPVFFATAGERGVVRVRLRITERIAAGKGLENNVCPITFRQPN